MKTVTVTGLERVALVVAAMSYGFLYGVAYGRWYPRTR